MLTKPQLLPTTIQIPPRLEPILHTRAKVIVLIGGRGSAKSETVGRVTTMWAETEQADILCGREYQNSIDDSVHKLLKGLIDTLGIPDSDVNITDKKIDFTGGGGFRYKGFARNSAAVKSAQGFKYAWIEEAQDLSQQSIDDLLPTIRLGNSKLLFTANPQASNDPFSLRFIAPFQKELDRDGYFEDNMHLVIMINWRDNPWHGELEEQRLWDKEHMSSAKYDHIWEGAYNDEVEDAIISADWFDACVDAHIKLGFKPRGAKVVSHDPSDKGPDPKSLCHRQGSVILDVQEKETLDANDGMDWACEYANEHNADLFIWDGDGLGAPLRRQVRMAFDGTRTDYRMYKGSEDPDRPLRIYEPVEGEDNRKGRTNKDTFKNKRAQYYWTLRDRCYNTYRAVVHGDHMEQEKMISFSSSIKDLKKLRSEICRIPRKHNPNGLIQIMTKVEMKRIGIASPNMADATKMSLEVPKVKKPARVSRVDPDIP